MTEQGWAWQQVCRLTAQWCIDGLKVSSAELVQGQLAESAACWWSPPV